MPDASRCGLSPQSRDLDLLIEFRGERSLLDLVALQLEVEETLDRGADVTTYTAFHPGIRRRVLSEQVPVL